MDKDVYDPIEGRDAPHYNAKWFTFWTLLSQVLGLLSLILMAVWTGSFLGGFGWTEDPAKQFNYHPLFMTIGLIFLYGDAILVYRVFRNERKIVTKFIHMGLQLAALIFAIVALVAVFSFHNASGIPNLYTAHSWLGLITVILFALQFLLGFGFYLFPTATQALKQAYMPVHIFFGLFIYGMAVASACIGINEKLIFLNSKDKVYENRSGEAWLGNIIVIVMFLSALSTAFVVTKPEYKRQPLPEEEQISLTRAAGGLN